MAVASFMKPITNAAELNSMCALPRALIFIYVDWAIQARQSEAIVQEFLEAWARSMPQCPVLAFRVDLSEQVGEAWELIRKLLQDDGQSVDSLTYGGAGALLWIRSGTVIASVINAAYCERSKLIAITKQALSCD